MIYQKKMTVAADRCDRTGNLRLSGLLQYAQEVSGQHSDALGFTWDTLASRNMFWAVLRHRGVIHRLPKAGESICLETWPAPATRVAYPRCVRALDETGNILFETVSLWVLMDMTARTMILPGKSGVDVPGVVWEDALDAPGSLAPADPEYTKIWQVSGDDLDVNGHVNNARYFDRIEPMLGSAEPREFTVCYLSEVLPEQSVILGWRMTADGILTVDGSRRKDEDPEKTERVFAVKLSCSVNQSEL